MVEVLNATIRVYKIELFSINGDIEFYFPEGQDSTIETSIEDVKDSQGKPADAVKLLGGCRFVNNIGKIKFYKLNDGDKISTKYSKYYDDQLNYWYEIRINLDRLLNKDIYIGVGDTPWQYHYEKDNYIPLTENHKNFINNCKFLKLSKKIELKKWNDVSEFSTTFFELMLSVLKLRK